MIYDLLVEYNDDIEQSSSHKTKDKAIHTMLELAYAGLLKNKIVIIEKRKTLDDLPETIFYHNFSEEN